PLRRGQTTEQQMSCIRAAYAAGLPIAIEGDSIKTELVTPEALLDQLAKPLRLLIQLTCTRLMAQRPGDGGRLLPRGENVALHFAEGDRQARAATVGVVNGIVRVLPALIVKSRGLFTGVLDQAVAIDVAIVVDPAQGRFDVRPEIGHGFPVARPPEIAAGKHDEERRGVDAAIVAEIGRASCRERAEDS